MYNIEIRRKWEKHFPVIEVVEELPKYKIVYWYDTLSVDFYIPYIGR